MIFKYLNNQRGDTNFVSIIIILAVAVICAILFMEPVSDLISSIF